MAVRSKMPTIKRRLPDCADCVHSYNPHNADYLASRYCAIADCVNSAVSFTLTAAKCSNINNYA